MKTLTKDGLSLYLFEDDKALLIEPDKITVGNPAELIIGDCNSGNTVLHENVTRPDGWIGGKYLYLDGVWSLNPDWVDFSAEQA
jgi:hypothetical protein